MLKTFDQATKSAEGMKRPSRRSGGGTPLEDIKDVSDLRQLCLVLCRMCIRRRSSDLRLEQARHQMQDEHALNINEMTFQCTKLSELFKLEPLRSAFVLGTGQEMVKLTLGDPSSFHGDVREIHTEAVSAEQAWERNRE